MNSKSSPMPRRLIRRDELQLRVPYSMTHIWRLEQMPEDEDPFPSRIVIGEGRVAWDSDAVDAWIDRRIRASAGKKIRSPRKAVAEESR